MALHREDDPAKKTTPFAKTIAHLEHDKMPLTQALRYVEGIVNTMHEGILVLDTDLCVVSANRSYHQLFQAAPVDTIGHPFFALGNGQWRVPALAHLLEDLSAPDVTVRTYEISGEFPHIGHHTVVLNARQVQCSPQGTALIMLAINDITEQAQVETALRDSERRYRELFANMLDGFSINQMIYDEQGRPVDFRYLEVNQRFEAQTGLARDRVIGRCYTELFPDYRHDSFDWIATYGHVASTGEAIHFQQYFLPLHRWFDIRAYSPEHGYFAAVFTDITEQKVTEERAACANRALRVLSASNQMLVRTHDEQALMENVCRILVDIGGYQASWIGLAIDDDVKSIRVAASAGFDRETIASMCLSWSDAPTGYGPTGTAIRTGAPVVMSELSTLEVPPPWSEEAIRRGFLSAVGLPLQVSGRIFGALSIFAGDQPVFTEDEIALLQELAEDLAYGLEVLRTRAERRRAEERQQLAIRILEHLNQSVDATTAIRDILGMIQHATGINAIAIRLNDGEDFPFYDTSGFPADLVTRKHALFERHADGGISHDADGPAQSACLCEMIVQGKTDPSCSYFTVGGSFWTNGATELLASHPEVNQMASRRQCYVHGYESMAIIPLRSGTRVIGLLQLHDSRPDCFTAEMITFFEGIGASIGIALQRIQTENALRVNEDRLSKIFATVPGGITIVDKAGKIIFTNPGAERILGLQQHARMTYDDPEWHITDVDGSPFADEALPFSRVLRTGHPVHDVQYAMESPDGKRVILSVNAAPYQNQAGEVVGIVAAIDDITERHQAEESLIRSRDFYLTLFEEFPALIWRANVTGQCDYVNRTCLEFTGLVGEQMLGDRWFARVHPDDRTSCEQTFREAFEQRQPFAAEFRLRRWDGQYRWMRDFGSPFTDLEGNFAGYIGSCYDFTDWREAREEFELTNEKLQRALEGTVHALATTAEWRDPYTAGHQQRVAQLAAAIASELALSDSEREIVRVASLLHDIGKMAIPLDILAKPAALNAPEFALVRTHAQIGYEILRGIDFPWPIADIVHQHHERLDGSGYPHGKQGEEISLAARIIGVADVVEAMSTHRPYRPALGIQVALDEVIRKAGIAYDAEVVQACIRLFTEKGFQLE